MKQKKNDIEEEVHGPTRAAIQEIDTQTHKKRYGGRETVQLHTT